ncbi:hypothetical protein QBC46DRAFT_358552 [Diplogelasinospora grovesii]|uniref:Uncharacterized protein n=1 Tax=Diplogelasinospora grovesii TaxID=303347 RepID=A0AAN6MX16_9PEZI|nr:hypothetical protein QBC46DRAFT_358552 [Diplogelasinospora grovesii]
MSPPNNSVDKIEEPVQDDGLVDSVDSDCSDSEEDTRERPWKGFWPPPSSNKQGYPYAIIPGDVVIIAGN